MPLVHSNFIEWSNIYIRIERLYIHEKKSELIKLIKTSVREEIEACLPKIINELLTDKPVKSVDPVEIASEVLSVGRTKRKKNLKHLLGMKF